MKTGQKSQQPSKAELKAKIVDLQGQLRNELLAKAGVIKQRDIAYAAIKEADELSKLNAPKQDDGFGYQSPEREGPILAFKYHQALRAILVAAPMCETCRAIQSIAKHTLDKFGGGQ